MKRLMFLFLFTMTAVLAYPSNDNVKVEKKNTIFRRIGKVFTKIFKNFNDIDTNYIEPQHYNYP